MNKFRNIILAGTMSTMLTACGGGGGGAPGAINDFIQNDLSNLSGSSTIISSTSSLLTSFNSTIAAGDFSAFQAVLTGPDADDQNTAKTLLTQLGQAETLWQQTEALINAQDDATKYKIYNSDSYKEAYASLLYLKNHVKPIIQKVSEGKSITLVEFNKVAKQDKADEIILDEKNSTASEYSNTKKIKSQDWVKTRPDDTVVTVADGDETKEYTSEWETVNAGGGKLKRTFKTTTAQLQTTTVTRCTAYRTTFLNGSYSDDKAGCSTASVTTIAIEPKVETGEEFKDGPNPVITEEILDPAITNETETSAEYTVTTYVDADSTTNDITKGTATSTNSNRDETTQVNAGGNIWNYTTTRYVDTKTITPVTTKTYKKRTYTDAIKVDTRTKTTTITKTKYTYKDGTSETINGAPAITYSDWTTSTKSTSTREENILQSTVESEEVKTVSDAGTVIKTWSSNVAYTDLDENLGTKTTNYNSNKSYYETTEYNRDNGKEMINASSAYSRGWTGEGSTVGVIDSYQDTDHKELKGKYKWYNDYVRYEDGTTDSNGNELGTLANGGKLVTHGTQVAGVIAAKNDGEGVHGVAFDSELVGANIDYHGTGSAHMSYASQALHDMVKLKSKKADGGENIDIVAINMSFNKTHPTIHYGEVNELDDGTYSVSKITDKMDQGGNAKYWKIATDNDIILVNSAGNGIYKDGAMDYTFSLDPGLWATEVDENGDLVLGGKMILAGWWDGTQVQGSTAGHVCLDIDTSNNTCNDKYKISDFYVLAPGNNILSTVPQDGYAYNSGSSFSAPMVTGSLAILHQMWPYMKGENLVKLVLDTADKDITGYNVNIHGQGVLDLDEATKPQGAIGITTTGRVDGATVGLNNTYYSTGTGNAFSLSGIEVMVVDSYDKNYYIDLGSTISVKDTRKVSDNDMQMNGYHYLPHQSTYGSWSQGGKYDLGYMNFTMFSGEGGNGDFSTSIGKDFSLTDKLTFKTSVGTMSEQNTWLGNNSDGVLAVGKNNNTNFGQLGFEYKVGNNNFMFDFSQGTTDINTRDNSLITGFSDITTQSYKLGWEKELENNNTFGLSFSVPTHIKDGTMELTVPKSVNLDGTVNYERIDSDMSGNTFEKDIGFYFTHKANDELDSNFSIAAEYRQDISGIAGNDGVNIGFSYKKKIDLSCGFLIWKNPKCYNSDGSKKSYASLYSGHKETTTALALQDEK